jgi:hypothetical protein
MVETGDGGNSVKSPPIESRRFTFRFPNLDTVLQVDVLDDAVTIKASRNTFSAKRRIAFVRELVSEGFIPDEFQWASGSEFEADYPIQWIVDRSCFERVESAADSRRLAIKLFTSTAVLVTLMMGMLFTGHLGNVRVAKNESPRDHVRAWQTAANSSK